MKYENYFDLIDSYLMNRRACNYIERDISNTAYKNTLRIFKGTLFQLNPYRRGTPPYLAINPSLTDPAQYFMFRYGARYFIRALFSRSQLRHTTKQKKNQINSRKTGVRDEIRRGLIDGRVMNARVPDRFRC